MLELWRAQDAPAGVKRADGARGAMPARLNSGSMTNAIGAALYFKNLNCEQFVVYFRIQG